jgi:hypothetical protein
MTIDLIWDQIQVYKNKDFNSGPVHCILEL